MAHRSPSGYEVAPQLPKTSSLAVASLVTGIAAWVLVPILAAIIAIITGHMAKSEIRRAPGRLTGDGLATAGLVLGYLQMGVTILAICLFLLFFIPAISNFSIPTFQVIGTPTPFGQ